MTNHNDIKTICVCGAGTMGRGIAQVAAQNGFECILYDVSDLMVRQSSTSIEQGLQSLVDKGKMTVEEKNHVLSRLRFTNSMDDCKADLLIEAIVENLELKTELFWQLQPLHQRLPHYGCGIHHLGRKFGNMFWLFPLFSLSLNL